MTVASKKVYSVLLKQCVGNLRGCTVHVDNIKFFICPTNAHINYSKIVELLKTFKTTIIAPTRFGLHKTSSGSSQSVLRQSYNIYFSVYTSLMKILVLWLRMRSHSTENFINDVYTLKSIL